MYSEVRVFPDTKNESLKSSLKYMYVKLLYGLLVPWIIGKFKESQLNKKDISQSSELSLPPKFLDPKILLENSQHNDPNRSTLSLQFSVVEPK